jgi:hypothetical protein
LTEKKFGVGIILGAASFVAPIENSARTILGSIIHFQIDCDLVLGLAAFETAAPSR